MRTKLGIIAGGGLAMGAAAGIGAGLAAGLVVREVYRRTRGTDLRGKVVWITGSSRGLGLAMAEEFARRGARLVICARDEQELEAARAQLEAKGAEVLAVRCDVTNVEEIRSLVEQANRRFGGIDVLVNNAGIITVGPMESQNLADYEECMRVMYWGPVYCTLAVLPQMMRDRRGWIANITSIGGKVAVPHLLPYSAAKFAAVGFSEGLRAEVARHGIKVTTVVPGLMRTGSHVNAYFKGKHRQEYSWFSLGATLPVTAMSARRAARRIVNAVRVGRAEIILTPQAKLLAAFHGLFPGITADVLSVVNRAMPAAEGGDTQRHLGKESETPITRSALTSLGRKAGEELNQFGPDEAAATA
jgi:short-subunit dehydrogenase